MVVADQSKDNRTSTRIRHRDVRVVLSCAMFQRPPFDPNAAAHRRPGARDGRQALARQQQWFHLLAHRAAAIQFSLPVDWTGFCDRRKRQQYHCSECILHVSSGIRSRSRSQFMCPRGLIGRSNVEWGNPKDNWARTILTVGTPKEISASNRYRYLMRFNPG